MGQGPKVVPSIKNHPARQPVSQSARLPARRAACLPACLILCPRSAYPASQPSDRSGALAVPGGREAGGAACVCVCVCLGWVCVAPIRFVLNCIFAVLISLHILRISVIPFFYFFSFCCIAFCIPFPFRYLGNFLDLLKK